MGNGPPSAHARNRRQPASMQHVEATVGTDLLLLYGVEKAAGKVLVAGLITIVHLSVQADLLRRSRRTAIYPKHLVDNRQ